MYLYAPVDPILAEMAVPTWSFASFLARYNLSLAMRLRTTACTDRVRAISSFAPLSSSLAKLARIDCHRARRPCKVHLRWRTIRQAIPDLARTVLCSTESLCTHPTSCRVHPLQH